MIFLVSKISKRHLVYKTVMNWNKVVHYLLNFNFKKRLTNVVFVENFDLMNSRQFWNIFRNTDNTSRYFFHSWSWQFQSAKTWLLSNNVIKTKSLLSLLRCFVSKAILAQLRLESAKIEQLLTGAAQCPKDPFLVQKLSVSKKHDKIVNKKESV